MFNSVNINSDVRIVRLGERDTIMIMTMMRITKKVVVAIFTSTVEQYGATIAMGLAEYRVYISLVQL